MPHVLAFRHVPFEGVGRAGPVLAARGFAVEYVDLYRPDAPLPDISQAAALIFLGCPMSANDSYPYLQREIGFIRAAVERRQPVLGICLGAQLTARALGAAVHRSPEKEIGWFDIHPTAEGARDPLFSVLEPTETVFHWHGETFDLPSGASRLAYSAACPNQAFRAGPNVYGLQFHLEVTPEMIADWCCQDENAPDTATLSGPIDPHRHAPRLACLAEQLFGNWCKLI